MMIPAFPSLPEPAAILSPMQMMGKLSGFGDDAGGVDISAPSDASSVDLTPIFTDIGLPAPSSTLPAATYSTYPNPPGQGVTVPASGLTPAQTLNFANLLASGGFSLAREVAAQPGMSISPTGALTYQNPGYPVPGIAGSLTTPSSSSMTVIAVAVIAALAVFGISRGRG